MSSALSGLTARLRLRRRVQLLAAAFVALIGLNLLVSARLTIERDQTADVVEKQLQPARQEVANLLNAVISQSTGQRGYLITGRPQPLDAYLAGRASTTQAIQELRRLLSDKPDLLAALTAGEEAIAKWQAQVLEPEIAARRSGRPGDAEALVAAEESLQLFDAGTDRVDDLRRELNAELTQAEGQRDRSRTLLTRMLFVSLLAAIALLVLARSLVRRWLNDPLEDLGRSVAAGRGRRPGARDRAGGATRARRARTRSRGHAPADRERAGQRRPRQVGTRSARSRRSDLERRAAAVG